MNFEFHPQALAEYKESARYYANQQIGLEQRVGWGELANPNKNKYMRVNVGVRSSPNLQFEAQQISAFVGLFCFV